MENYSAGELTQNKRKLALAKYLANSRLKEKLGISPEQEEIEEVYNDLEEENVFVFNKKNDRDQYLVLTKQEIEKDCREKMLCFERNREDTELLAEEANMTVEEYVDDFIENDEYRENAMLVEYEKIDETYYIKFSLR